jgi:tetratricopeptide (TPR) repeat protein
MRLIERSGMFVLAVIISGVGWGSTAEADWAACQTKPTRVCLMEEALRGDGGPLTGKERLDVLVQGGALSHSEIITPADTAEAQRLAGATPNLSNLYYASLAVHGLIATNQKQQAINLVASLAAPGQTVSLSALQNWAFREVVTELVKAGDVETALAVPDKIQPLGPKVVPELHQTGFLAVVNALAGADKVDQALMLMAGQKYLNEISIANPQTAIGQAYLKRGDSKLAQSAFDQASKNQEAGMRYSVGSSVQVRFISIKLLALQGKVDEVNAALAQLRSDNAASSNRSTEYEMGQGYQGVVAALLEAKKPDAALSIAKAATPDTAKETSLAQIAIWYATNGRPADARNVLASMTSAPDSGARLAVVRNLAIAAAKQGDAAAALKSADEVHNLPSRRGVLFAVALALPQ